MGSLDLFAQQAKEMADHAALANKFFAYLHDTQFKYFISWSVRRPLPVCVCVCERVVRGCLSFQQTMLYALTTSCPGIYRFVPSDAAVQHGTRNAWLQSFTVAQQCNHQQVRSERRHRRLVR